VFLLRIEEEGPDGKLQPTWSGDVPIRWRHQEIFPLERTVGAPADCDLCSVVKYEIDRRLYIHPLIVPLNLRVERTGRQKFEMIVQARANEGVSPITRVQISWDGDWADGEVEMGKHFKVILA
jgi:hypothetical protein